MTPTELEWRASAMYGQDWQSPLARRIRVDPRTVRRWKAGEREIPEWLDVLLSLLEKHPRDR
jgi:DNA-binding transcriptional regulator YiaG